MLAEAALADGRRVWIVYCSAPIEQLSMKQDRSFGGSAHVAPDFDPTAELRGFAVGSQDDGSLSFWDVRVEAKKTDNTPRSF